MPDPAEPGIPGSAEALRQVMGRFASGVTVVTANKDGIAHAMTATAVSSVSLDPPLILVCVSRASRFHAAILAADGWCVSLLAQGQEPVARHFANRGRDLATQFNAVGHRLSELSATPIVDDALAWVECTTYARYDGGDHTIMVGRIERAGVDEPSLTGPLTYYRGIYS